MRAILNGARVYLWLGAMDMRVGFDRLAGFVSERFGQRVMGGGFYLFLSRCRSRVKILYWDRDGYALWHKRLEAGAFRVERSEEQEEITGVDLEALLSGVEYSRIKFRKLAEKGSFK